MDSRVSDSVDIGWGLRLCTSNKSLGEVDTDSLGITL